MKITKIVCMLFTIPSLKYVRDKKIADNGFHKERQDEIDKAETDHHKSEIHFRR